MAAITSVLAVAGLIGGGLSAYGQIQSAKVEQTGREYNAQISEQEAGRIRESSLLTEFKQRKQLRQNVGSMVASTAGSGIEFTGSPLDVIKDSIANAELDISIGKYNAEVEAKRKEDEARLERYYGKQAVKSSYYSAGSTLLTSAATAGFRLSEIGGKK